LERSGAEWIAQLVRENSDKFVFGLIRLTDLLKRILELRYF
jgi:hypothetical protein